MANAQTTLGIPEFLYPTINKIFGANMKDRLDWEDSGYVVSTSAKAYIDDKERASVGPARVKNQNELAELESGSIGFGKRYTMVATGLRVVVSEETIRFSQYEEVVDGTKDCALSLKLNQEYTGADVFIKAYTSGYNGGDGVTFASASHTLPNGGTYSNQLPTFMSLSETAIETMWAAARRMPDSNGYQVNGFRIKKIVAAPENEFELDRILKSAQQNDTANNAINALKNKGVESHINTYLTATDEWIGITDAKVGLRWIWAVKPEFRDDGDMIRMSKTYSGYQNYDCGWTDPRGAFFSNT
jgi:hypothetical protein